MKNPLIIGLIVYVLLLAGAFAGWKMRKRLPAHHLTDETKSFVSMSTAVVATISWASHFKRQYKIHSAWGRSNQSVSRNTPT